MIYGYVIELIEFSAHLTVVDTFVFFTYEFDEQRPRRLRFISVRDADALIARVHLRISS